MFFLKCVFKCLLLTSSLQISLAIRTYTKNDLIKLREEVRGMFYHAYDSYLKYAYPYDELRPISCDGINTYGSYSLTLIDALDTLAIMGNYSEFARVVEILSKKNNFDSNINVSVFETNIRIIGGLLSAHLLSNKAGIELEPGWPCNGPLLRLAEDVAKRLIVAFDTKTGMPYGTVNLHSGVPKGETTITCTAGIGTFIVEFGTLSRLTGDPLYEEVAMNALYSLFNYKSNLGLFGNHIDIDSGRWTAQDAGIGSGVDSYFEYLVKGSILLQRPELMEMFFEARKGIDKYLKKDDWYMWVSMTKGQVTLPVFQSLEAFWPGLMSLIGETSNAMKTLLNYHQVWQQYGFTPEFYYIPQNEAGTNKESYPLRPELIESIMYLYRSTGDPYLLQAGEDILRSIQHSAKTPCGYATIKDVRDHKKEDRMESFFLSETTKYLYLLFDTENFIHNTGQYGTVIDTPNGECVIDAGGYIFNTEAHPIDPSALHCCHSISRRNILDFKVFEQNKSLFRGDSIKERQIQANVNVENNIKISEEILGPITTESSSTYIKLEDNDNISQKIQIAKENSSQIQLDNKKYVIPQAILEQNKPKYKWVETNTSDTNINDRDNIQSNIANGEYKDNSSFFEQIQEITTSNVLEKILSSEKKKFDPQEMLERFRKENKYWRNSSLENNYKLLSCRAQPFLQRISILGEIFNKYM